MATPALDLAGIQAELKLLRDQVDVLQIAVAEKRSPWYKQASILISVIALVLSSVGGAWSYFVQHRKEELQNRSDKLLTLQRLAADIIDVNKDIQDSYSKDPTFASNVSGMLNSKREIMLSRATDLTKDLDFAVPAEVLYVFAMESQTDGNTGTAEILYQKALAESSSEIVKINCMQGLAGLYMTPHAPTFNLALGRQYFKDVVTKMLADRRDENSIFRRAGIYDRWGAFEYMNDSVKEGFEAYNNARQEYLSLPQANPNRQMGVNMVLQHRIAMFQNTSLASALIKKLEGSWRTGAGDEPIILTVKPSSTGPVQATIQFGTSGALNAFVSLEDDSSADISWTPPSPPYVNTPPYAITGKLRMIQDGMSWSFEWFNHPNPVRLFKA